mgnify:CR=1 FL=1
MKAKPLNFKKNSAINQDDSDDDSEYGSEEDSNRDLESYFQTFLLHKFSANS